MLIKIKSSLKILRQEIGLTQKEMGVVLGMNQQQISRIETGRKPITKYLKHKLELIRGLWKSDNLSIILSTKQPIKKRD